MRKMLRILSVLLCVALVSSAFHVDADLFARAEGVPEVIVEEIPDAGEAMPADAEELPAETLRPETTAEPSPEPGDDVTPAPSVKPSVEPSVEPSAEPSIDSSAVPSIKPSVEPSVSPSPESSAEPTPDVSGEAALSPSAEPTIAPTAEATVEPTAEPSPEAPAIDYTKNAGESTAFEAGFAEILSGDTIVYKGAKASDEEHAKLGKGVVYAVSRSASGPDRIEIAYNPDPESGVELAWVDAEDIRPMNPSAGGEVEAYLAACADDDEVRCYREDEDIPLRLIACAYPEIHVEIYLNHTSAVIGEKDSGLDLDVVFSDGRDHAVRFESSKPKYASVDAETGVVTGLKRGEAVIRAFTEFGYVDCAVTVKRAPKSVSVQPKEGVLGVGESGQLSVSFSSSSYGGSCRFESSNPEVAAVDEYGRVTGVSKGTAEISVYVYSQPKKPAISKITVLGPATALSFSEDEVSLSRGMDVRLSVNFLPGERDTITYSSDNEDVAIVDARGYVLALEEGEAVVTAATPNGVQAQCRVTVLPAPYEDDIVLLANNCNVGLKESFNMMELLEVNESAHAEFTFESSKSRYASVDAEGNVKGLKKGSATIRATTQNGIVRDLKVTVCNNPKSVSFAEKELTIGRDMSVATTLKFDRSGAYSRCVYSSSDESVATVDARGVITGVSAGVAVITADPAYGKSGTCRVTVKNPPEKIWAAEESMNVGLGESGRRVQGMHGPDEMCSFSYASMNEAVARVDAVSGEITTVSEGSAEIVITAGNGVTASCMVNVLKAPTQLSLSQSEIRIMVGESYRGLRAIVDEGAASGLTFSAGKSKYVKIEDGAIVGLRKGSATITASTYNGVTATCRVTVCEAPRSISFKQDAIRIGELDTAVLQLSFNKSASYSPVSYTSSDETVARVDDNGTVTALREGTAVITAETLNGKRDSCSVTVEKAPESVSAAEAEISMGRTEKGRKVQGIAPEGTLCSFRYESLNPDIAIVDAVSGVLSGVSAGVAEVLITAHNGAYASCMVHVMEDPMSLTLSHNSLKIIVGEKNTDLRGAVNEGAASDLHFESSREKYVKIEDGAIVGVRIGTAVVTVSTYNGIEAECKVTVTAAPTSIYFEEDNLHIGCNERASTAVGFRPAATAGKLRYSSDKPEVATVDPVTGEVQGVHVGTAVITATALNGVSDSCTVHVYPAPTSLRFEGAAADCSVGMKKQLKVLLSEGSMGGVFYESANPGVASVDEDGIVHALSEGSAVITARSYNGFSASCTVNVGPAPASVRYDFDKLLMLKGDTIVLPEPEALDAQGNPCPAVYSFTSSRSNTAQVGANGEVRALRNGEVKITAISHNGLRASFELEITDEIPKLNLSPAQAVLYADGMGYAGTVQLSSDSSASLTYASSNPEVAVVDANGLVTAVAPGSATISARAVNGSYAAMEVSVLKLTTSISLGMESVELGEGEEIQLVPQIDPDSSAIVHYTSDNSAIAQVDENGLVRAVGEGSTLVIASTVNGRRAVLRVDVIPGPTELELGVNRLRLGVGEGIRLNPRLSSAAEHFCKNLRYVSDEPDLASVDAEGNVLAHAAGTAVITVTSCNGLTDSCIIEVTDAAPEAPLAFTADSFSIVSGDSAELPLVLAKAAYERGWSVSSSDPDLLSADGASMHANAVRAGSAVLTVSLNPDPANPDAMAYSVSCTVEVVSYASVTLSAAELEVEQGASVPLSFTLNPANLTGTFEISILNPELASYDPASGLVTADMTEGETLIRFRTYSEAAECRLIVKSGVNYRALVIGEYNKSGASNDLPFAANNLYTVKNTFGYSSVNGAAYEITTAFSNPGKGEIRGLIQNSFAEADENDVSFIYIVSHGHYSATASDYMGYYFSLAPDYSKSNPNSYVRSDELMAWLGGIEGRVILVLDSCRSGGFIRDCRDELQANGNIAVLTAQSWDKNASFYVGKSEETTVEFLTYALCYGLGVQQRNNYLSAMPADDDGDGCITLVEAFDYARSETKSLVAEKIGSYKKGSKTGFYVPGGLTSGWSQNPQAFIPEGMEDLVFYGRELVEEVQPAA